MEQDKLTYETAKDLIDYEMDCLQDEVWDLFNQYQRRLERKFKKASEGKEWE